MNLLRVSLACVVAGLCTLRARADDAFFRVPLSDIKIEQGELPAGGAAPRWDLIDVLRPYAVLDGPGEAFVTSQAATDVLGSQGWVNRWSTQTGILAARAPAGKPLTGWMFVPNDEWTALVPLKFSLEPQKASPEARNDFYRAMAAHYEALQQGGAPGTAWFRYQADLARRELGSDEARQRRPNRRTPGGSDLDETYDLFTGGRAVSENLQLDRDLPPEPNQDRPAPEATVPVDSLEGITVQAMDWTKLLESAGGQTNPEVLAAAIPADQHAVFLPSFDALAACLDEVKKSGLPVFRTLSPRSEDARLIDRYERQLGLSLGTVTRMLGPRMVRAVAITGSDPYFPTGTDLAILFDSPNAKALHDVVLAQVRLVSNAPSPDGKPPAAQKRDGEIDGVKYAGTVSDDRSVSSYVAIVGDAVVVTNSLQQLRALVRVKSGSAPSLASLPEYRFFRARYPAASADQTGFLFISDPTIRRWCGPTWRIGASRRLRAAAILADLTATHLQELVTGVSAPDPIKSDIPMRTIGDLALTPTGVQSAVYGVPPFLTPIAELDIKEVTKSEAAAYKRWRDTYQQNWSWAFDPIGTSFSIAPQRLSADLTVMPLILGTDYRTWLTFIQGVSIEAGAGDPHGAIAHGIVAMNVQSQAVQQASTFALMMAPQVKVDPLGWLGHSVALYADPDPFWAQMLDAPDAKKFFEERIYDIPVGLHAEVDSPLKLTAFLAALRAYLDQSAPGMTAWETRTHNDQPYVTVGLSETSRAQARGNSGFDRLKIHYAATPRALIVSPNEDVLKRALDRQAASPAPTKEGSVPAKDAPAPAKDGAKAADRPWLGSSMCYQFTREGLEIMQGPGRESYRKLLQHRSWANLWILNEWKRLFPTQDPVQVHEKHWGVRPICPAGGQYVWNEKLKTMESTVCGHPADPKDPPPDLGPLGSVLSGNFGLSFENNGLRARAVLDRDAPRK